MWDNGRESRFWIAHYAPPDKALHDRFLDLSTADAAEVLQAIGAPPAAGVRYSSPENRVFGFGAVVLKFFRPGRWSLAALQGELQFLEDLREAQVPFVRPIGGVGTWRGIHYLAYEAVEQPFEAGVRVLSEAAVRQLVRRLARIHDVGEQRDALGRSRFDPASMCAGCFEVICRAGFLPASLQARYADAMAALVRRIDALGEIPLQRIHGDSYVGNALWRPDGPVFLDLDDFYVGPVAVDLSLASFAWRLDSLPEEMDRRERRALQQQLVLDIYREVRPFPARWEALIPLVQGYRSIGFDAWFSARWGERGFVDHYPGEDLADPAWWRDAIEGLERIVAG